AGAAAWLGLPLTPATLAVLPVVLGLSTDYLLQAANRLAEERGSPADRFRRMARAILPATGLAAAATAAGVLAFAVSSLPLLRQFGLFLALGVAMSWLASVLVGLPLLALLARRVPAVAAGRSRSGKALVRLSRLPRYAALMLVMAGIAGWAALMSVRVETDPARLMPAGSPSLRQVAQVRSATGVTGEMDVVVTGPDVTSPQVVAWMGNREQALKGAGLVPLNGLPNFVLAFNYGQAPDAAATKKMLDALPPYFTGSVVSQDHHVAVITLGQTHLDSAEQDQALTARVTAAISRPPAGYRAYPAGLAVIASEALGALQAGQLRLNVIALGLVLLVLVVSYRRLLPALVVVTPTVAAAGWVTAAMAATGARQTPITVLLAGVIVAFATEFGVLWVSRYREQREAGDPAEKASETASLRVGPAILAAAAALVAAFGVLGVSPVPMVRDFGLWCAADLAVATAAVLVLLPPAARTLL
ncbi:MAG: MMPL family transporter, partial [Candidatus Dormibacteraeota bacterium]|nr:MMPL family transporter [Candidatus Dormibacteraeota bacterium]